MTADDRYRRPHSELPEVQSPEAQSATSEASRPGVAARMLGSLRRAAAGTQTRPRSVAARMGTMAIVVLAGWMATVGAVNAGGFDLRGNRNSDLAGLVRSQVQENRRLTGDLAGLRTEVDQLGRQDLTDPVLNQQLQAMQVATGMTAVKGPGVKVVLTDAPLEVAPPGVEGDLLVVHQQDIQMVVNLLWAGGAEAMTIQGQRVISTTGVKCVGNSVVLHGVPYAPPYEIVAIGNPTTLTASLDGSREVEIYKQYVEAYRLGWQQSVIAEVTMPAYQGNSTLRHAQPLR